MEHQLKGIVAKMPDSPGVYMMHDASGEIIYIGKAKSLKKRVSSYLRSALDAKTSVLMRHVTAIDYTLCKTESLALLLEAGLIHKHKPRYNISLRDDKSFPMVKISNEEFPLVCVTRKRDDDGAAYFGPYVSAGLLREALKIIRRQFPFRSCKTLPKRPCLYYSIHLCPAPCAGAIDGRRYAEALKPVGMILAGDIDGLIQDLQRQMQEKAEEKRYEEAGELRDKIYALTSLSSPISTSPDGVEDLQNLLKMKMPPLRVEAFDVSNIFGAQAVASMVSFYRGQPDKSNYRRFRIKHVKGIDDYGMIREAVFRRYRRVRDEGLPLPDLVIIDGGRAHLLAALQVLENLSISLPVIGIAKEHEDVYTKSSAEPLRCAKDRPALNLIRRIRDEAHRFALAYHHILRRKRLFEKP